ncbi:O-antigen ligase [Mycetohabitans rhizoxinica HKI 454]|uniref:O-antigen ligase n=3 Tax=Burkholderiaceae TaxID=119060 RepID=E5ATI4_MYCRK|nr:O-antigen ligase [Mycetohabitans rhizoxinica HKI 454]CBW75858.1 O-antigen ligase [Mycetohabitans rhizoxinica HKI 454]
MYPNRFVTGVATAAIILSPALVLTMQGGTGYCYFTLLMLALGWTAHPANWERCRSIWREYRLYLISMLALPVAVLFQVLVLHTAKLSAFDSILRFGLIVPSFLLLASLPSARLRLVQWGFVAGAIATGAWALYEVLHTGSWSMPERLGNAFMNPIPFGGTALLLGFLAFASLERDRKIWLGEWALKIIALLCGCYASYLSGARGAWIALPVLVWASMAGRHWLSNRWTAAGLVLLLIAALGALSTTNMVQERVSALESDIRKLSAGNTESSTGIRLELWKASLELYAEQPVFGVGKGRLKEGMMHFPKYNHLVSDFHMHLAHNEILSMLAEAGTVGLVCLLLLYGGPLRYFWKYRRHSDPTITNAAYMGLIMVLGTFVFGLTNDVFAVVMNAAFYALTTATLLATIASRRRELAER